MNQLNLEKLAFLCMSNNKDRKLILGKENMKFNDFNRLIYLMEYLEFHQLSIELWNIHSSKFNDKFKVLESTAKNENVHDICFDCEYEIAEQEEWIESFLQSIGSKDVCEWVTSILKEYK